MSGGAGGRGGLTCQGAGAGAVARPGLAGGRGVVGSGAVGVGRRLGAGGALARVDRCHCPIMNMGVIPGMMLGRECRKLTGSRKDRSVESWLCKGLDSSI